MIEHIIALFLTSLLTLVSVALLQVIRGYHVNATQVSQHEIETLTTRLQKEVKNAHAFDMAQDRLIIHLQDGRSISYHVQNNRLIRQISGSGGEIALYHCQKISLQFFNNQSIKIELTSTFDEVFHLYLSTVSLPLPIIDSEEEAFDD